MDADVVLTLKKANPRPPDMGLLKPTMVSDPLKNNILLYFNE
jgi:hypothetical protein